MSKVKYEKVDQRTHVLIRPNMYIGAIEPDIIETYIYNEEQNIIEKRPIQYIAGLYKIFDEILVNAIDHIVRLKELEENDINQLTSSNKKDRIHQTKNIKININKENGEISIFNDGDGISIHKDEKHNIYVPEMLLGHLLSSSNYDDSKERTIGGMNGIGASAANIYSTKFIVETVDSHRELKYIQEFSNNMANKTEPKITKYTKYPYTKITFIPDYNRFKLQNLSDDMYSLMMKRAYDVCALTPSTVKVYLNDKELTIKCFEKYCNLYLSKYKCDQVRHYELVNDRWELLIAEMDNEIEIDNDIDAKSDISSSSNKSIKNVKPKKDKEHKSFEQISFVNGIWTLRGGRHVEYIVNNFVKKFIDYAKSKKRKGIENVKPQYIKDNLIVFIKCTIPNPAFDSQSKELLTTPVAKFGSKCEISDKFIDKLYKSHILDKLLSLNNDDNLKMLKKTDGKKSNHIYGIPKLDDANWAGTDKSHECILILTEGLSAKTMAIAGLSEVGRDKYGVYPLKGKILNVDGVSVDKLTNNTEISDFKKIMGLESGREYKTKEDLKSLRYGKIMIFTDMDSDGHHIKGLIFNLLYRLWPSLLKNFDFAFTILTPIVKVKKSKEIISFYNNNDYKKWYDEHNNGKGWDIKYYKGLGTSTSSEAKEYFKNMNKVDYKWTNEKCFESIDLAFNKDKADNRKEWLKSYDRELNIEYSKNGNNKISYDKFINEELIHFSVYNIERSIPSICDGLKISTRKILFSCFKKNLIKDIKVAQLSGYVSEQSAYHHGEVSLQEAIVGMAQNFVGSNNINLLEPKGQFGTRIASNDNASARYIYTQLSNITLKIFNKLDNCILDYKNDDGLLVEPFYYLPVIPMVLINGAKGIGTGYSTEIPCYNPLHIINALKTILKNNDITSIDSMEFVPYFQGFTGDIIKDGTGKYKSLGKFKKLSSTKIEITELPIGIWTDSYKEFLDNMITKKSKILKNYINHSTETTVHFILEFYTGIITDEFISNFIKDFKLSSNEKLKTSYMNLLNEKGVIQKYNNVNDIIKEFYQIRLNGYIKRKEYILADLKEKIKYMNAKAKFILELINETLIMKNIKKDKIIQDLEDKEYPKKDDTFDYLIMMPLIQQTLEKKEQLLKDVEDLEYEIEKLEETTEKELWLEDLDELERAYKQFIKVKS